MAIRPVLDEGLDVGQPVDDDLAELREADPPGAALPVPILLPPARVLDQLVLGQELRRDGTEGSHLPSLLLRGIENVGHVEAEERGHGGGDALADLPLAAQIQRHQALRNAEAPGHLNLADPFSPHVISERLHVSLAIQKDKPGYNNCQAVFITFYSPAKLLRGRYIRVVGAVLDNVKSGQGLEETRLLEGRNMAKREPRNSPELIERIRRLMVEKRFNRSSFARALGYTRPWGYQFMDNEILVSAEVLQKIARLPAPQPVTLLDTPLERLPCQLWPPGTIFFDPLTGDYQFDIIGA